MNPPHPPKLQAALAECALHARVLQEAAAALPPRFDAADAAAVTAELRRSLDQAAYRFMKLQHSLGEKVPPGLLAATLDPLPPEARSRSGCNASSAWARGHRRAAGGLACCAGLQREDLNALPTPGTQTNRPTGRIAGEGRTG